MHAYADDGPQPFYLCECEKLEVIKGILGSLHHTVQTNSLANVSFFYVRKLRHLTPSDPLQSRQMTSDREKNCICFLIVYLQFLIYFIYNG